MIDKFRQYVNKQQFQPNIFGMFVNPFYFARKGLYENISAFADKITGKTLDIGCGQKPYESLFSSSQYVGLEIDTQENRQNKKANLFYNGKTFPFQDGEFDSVIANEVFEHVFNPNEFLEEIHRVMRTGGILLMTVPFCWDEHEQPNDFARYSSFGLKAILQKHSFAVIEQKKSINDIRVVFQMLNAYIYKKTVAKNVYINLLVTLFLMSPFNLMGELLSKVLPKNDDLYLDNIVLARKVEVSI